MMIGWTLVFPGLAVIAGTAAAVVILTSGPLANQDAATETAVPITTESTATPPAAESSVKPSETAGPAGSPYPPEAVFQWTDEFDFTLLPIADTSNWREVSGPTGAVVVRVPESWMAYVDSSRDLEDTVIGEGISLKKLSGPVNPWTEPGWINVDLSVTPFEVPIEYGEGALRAGEIQTPEGAIVEFRQFRPDESVARLTGALVLSTRATSVRGAHLLAGSTINYELTAEDVAIVLAIFDSIEVN